MQGYPTVKFFGEDKESPSEYQGGRDSDSLIAFAVAEWKKSQPPPEVRLCKTQPASPWLKYRTQLPLMIDR